MFPNTGWSRRGESAVPARHNREPASNQEFTPSEIFPNRFSRNRHNPDDDRSAPFRNGFFMPPMHSGKVPEPRQGFSLKCADLARIGSICGNDCQKADVLKKYLQIFPADYACMFEFFLTLQYKVIQHLNND